MHSFDPYDVRPVKFVEQANSNGWRIKVYRISAESNPHAEAIESEGMNTVLAHLPQPAITEQRYGVGFLIIHHGTMRNWYLLDWWEKGDILHHKLFSSPLDQPAAISVEPDKSLIACVHELRIIAFESEAWIRKVLCRDEEPSFENYLEVRLNSNN